MTFEGQYLTYNEYKELGGTLEETPFNLLEFEARKKIDERTLQRLKDIDSNEIPQEVKLCEFKMINSLQTYLKTHESISEAAGIKSENIDGYSITYFTTSEINEMLKSKNNELNDLIETYLFGLIINDEHLIYVGLD